MALSEGAAWGAELGCPGLCCWLSTGAVGLQVHLRNDCQFEELPCERADCKERVLRKDLRDHVEKTCKYREATCSHCRSQVPMITLQVQYSLSPTASARRTAFK